MISTITTEKRNLQHFYEHWIPQQELHSGINSAKKTKADRILHYVHNPKEVIENFPHLLVFWL